MEKIKTTVVLVAAISAGIVALSDISHNRIPADVRESWDQKANLLKEAQVFDLVETLDEKVGLIVRNNEKQIDIVGLEYPGPTPHQEVAKITLRVISPENIDYYRYTRRVFPE